MAKDNLLNSLVKQEFIDQIPGFFGVLSLDSRFLMVNQTGVNWTGFKSSDQMMHLSYGDVRCKAAEHANLFLKHDAKLINSEKTLKFLGYYCYQNNDWKVIFGQKYLLRDSRNNIIGLISQFNEYTRSKLFDLSRFLMTSEKFYNNKFSKEQFFYFIEDDFQETMLSKRQTECIFFLLRGKSLNEIATILKLSKRTVENYVEEIKIKFNCSCKADLIEKAILDGYMNIIPETLIDL